MIAKVRTPKTQSWWTRLFAQIMMCLLGVGIISFALTHSDVSIVRFSDADSEQVRQQKLNQLAGIVEENPNEVRSVSISYDNDP